MILVAQFLASLRLAGSEWRFDSMKRWLFLAVAALLGFSASAARADYFIIKVNLASTKENSQTDPNAQFAQQPGGSGLMPGASGQPGFGFQGMGMGQPGIG